VSRLRPIPCPSSRILGVGEALVQVGFFDEPELQFADGSHIDVRAGIFAFGTLDRGAPAAPVPIRVGIVGTPATVRGVVEWLDRCAAGIAAADTKLKDLRPSFPGMTETTFGTKLEIAHASNRAVPDRDLRELLAASDPMKGIVQSFLDHARDLASRGTLNVLVIAPPAEVFALGDAKTPADDVLDEGAEAEPSPYTACFHDRFKAAALELGIPCQLVRPDTYGGGTTAKSGHRRPSLQDEATRAWNFHTALYYKAGAVPWRLVRNSASLSTCHVGVSFFRTINGDRVLASVAQVFDERGEGVIVQGGNARIDKDDRSPHLTALDAQKLVLEALGAYRREHRTLPARMVVHKTSYFDAAEIDGCRAAADELNIDVLDLISLRRSRVRLFREGTYPVLRGTTLTFDERSGLVYLRGSVPQFRTYPGMYVPTSLEFQLAHGDVSAHEVGKELLDLSKLNFNNTQFDGGEPITVRAARRVGDILKHVSPERQVQSRFRFFT
jgi:hypothetical protein